MFSANSFELKLAEALQALLETYGPIRRYCAQDWLDWSWSEEEDSWFRASSTNKDLILGHALPNWTQVLADLQPAVEGWFPMYLGMVGTALGVRNQSVEDILSGAFRMLLQRAEPRAAVTEVPDVVAQFVTFLRSNEVPVRVIAPVNYLRANGPQTQREVRLGEELTLRLIQDNEATGMWGGSASGGRSPRDPWSRHAIVTECREPKRFGDLRGSSELKERVWPSVRRAANALRCSLPGSAGCDRLYYLIEDPTWPAQYWKMMFPHIASNSPSRLTSTAETELPAIFAALGQPLHSTLRLAIERLEFAESRASTADRLVDAVVGLEALLLSGDGGGDERYKGELRFRFSLNYALLGPPTERRERFRTGKAIYDTRSAVVHGGSKVRQDGLKEEADEAVRALRETIRLFIYNGAKPSYLSGKWWEGRIFDTI